MKGTSPRPGLLCVWLPLLLPLVLLVTRSRGAAGRVLKDPCLPSLNPADPGHACGNCWCTGDFADCSKAAEGVLDSRSISGLPSSVRYLQIHRADIANDIFGSEDLDGSDDPLVQNGITHLSIVNTKVHRPTMLRPWLGYAYMLTRMQNLVCLTLDGVLSPTAQPIDKNVFVPGDLETDLEHTFDFLADFADVKSLRTLSMRRDTFSVLRQFGLEIRSDGDCWLETLLLGGNLGVEAAKTSACLCSNLKVLDLSQNALTSLTNSDCQYKFVETMYLDQNVFTTFPRTCGSVEPGFIDWILNRPKVSIVSYPRLKHLDLCKNYIQTVIGPVCLPSLQTLDLSENNLLRYLFHGSLSTLHFPALLELYLNAQLATTTSFDIQDSGKVSSVRCLSIANNKLDFRKLQRVAFDKYPNVEELVLDDNSLNGVTDSQFVRLFGVLKKLKTLSMARCGVDTIISDAFSNFSQLSALSLSQNRIAGLPKGVFDGLGQLRVLDLSLNSIPTVSESTFGDDTRGRLTGLNLAFNPFVCSCDLRWFRNWVVSTPELFTPNQSTVRYDCANLQGVKLKDYFLSKQACLISHIASGLIIMGCSLFIITLTTVSLLSRYRWHLRLLMYEAFRGRGDEARVQRLLNNRFDYDVFVSFAAEDMPWVQRHLIPELEGRLGLKLCNHERDFTLGRNIVDNIAECVESSKKVMMVFSKNFVLSQWCQFELTYCLRHVMDYDDNLIVVCVDDVVSHEMSTAMMAVLKTTTYIQWVNVPDAVEAFWGRVKLALNEIFQLNEHNL